MKTLALNEIIYGAKINSEVLNDIYHTDDADELMIKLDLCPFKIGLPEFLFLVKCYVYHVAFWPHTKPRYDAFMAVLRKKKSKALVDVCCKHSNMLTILDEWKKSLDGYEGKKTPGVVDEIKYLDRLINVVKKIRENVSL